MLQLWESGSLETLHLLEPPSSFIHMWQVRWEPHTQPFPSPSSDKVGGPLPPAPLPWTSSPFPSSSSPAVATVSQRCLPMTPHPHPSTASAMGRLTSRFGFFSVLQISLKTSFPREPSYLVSTTGSRGRFTPSWGAETSEGWGEQEGRRMTLLQPHAWSGFHCVGK